MTDRGRRWWETAVVYQIYPRSFCDTSGDGIGDLEGIRRHLDHLAWLGVDALWLSPFYPSPMADFGYDVADYCDVDPLFGTLDDFDRLTAEAHDRGMKVLVDWVPNHTSDQHPWFVASRSSAPRTPSATGTGGATTAPTRPGAPGPPGSAGRLPNNWRAAFPGVGRTEFPPAWTWDEPTGQWYLHLFLPEQPDLNWTNPEVRAAMTETLRFWLDRGVDGFRVDVVHGLGKDPAAPRPARRPGRHAVSAHQRRARRPIPSSPRLRTVLDGWPDPPPRMMVGEVFLPEPAQVATYYGTAAAPELHLAFNFKPHVQPAGTPAAGGTASTRSRPLFGPDRGLAHLGAVQPRPAPAPHPLRLRGPGPGRGGAAADPARHAVPLRRRGARPGGRRRPARPPGRPRRPGRVPGADPLGRHPPTAGPAGPRPGCPGRRRPTPAGRSPRARRPDPRCTCTAGCSLSGARRRRCRRGLRLAGKAPAGATAARATAARATQGARAGWARMAGRVVPAAPGGHREPPGRRGTGGGRGGWASATAPARSASSATARKRRACWRTCAPPPGTGRSRRRPAGRRQLHRRHHRDPGALGRLAGRGIQWRADLPETRSSTGWPSLQTRPRSSGRSWPGPGRPGSGPPDGSRQVGRQRRADGRRAGQRRRAGKRPHFAATTCESRQAGTQTSPIRPPHVHTSPTPPSPTAKRGQKPNRRTPGAAIPRGGEPARRRCRASAGPRRPAGKRPRFAIATR